MGDKGLTRATSWKTSWRLGRPLESDLMVMKGELRVKTTAGQRSEPFCLCVCVKELVGKGESC